MVSPAMRSQLVFHRTSSRADLTIVHHIPTTLDSTGVRIRDGLDQSNRRNRNDCTMGDRRNQAGDTPQARCGVVSVLRPQSDGHRTGNDVRRMQRRIQGRCRGTNPRITTTSQASGDQWRHGGDKRRQRIHGRNARRSFRGTNGSRSGITHGMLSVYVRRIGTCTTVAR